MHFKKHILSYVLIPLLVFVGIVSYYRFMVLHDYMVTYEGDCDPATHSCFVGCNDDACTDTYFYAEVEKYEPTIYSECGPDITDCAAANVCAAGDTRCTIRYCDPATSVDGCSSPEDAQSSVNSEGSDVTNESS